MLQKTGTEVTVRNEAGEEFRKNTAFVKKYNEQDNLSRPNGKENSSPEEVGRCGKVVSPTMAGVVCLTSVSSSRTQKSGMAVWPSREEGETRTKKKHKRQAVVGIESLIQTLDSLVLQ